jgi:hypothetical protein
MSARQKFKQGVTAAFETRKKALSTIFLSSIFLIIIALSTAINYSIQMFSNGIEYWIPAIELTISGLYLNGGLTGLGTNIIYSGLIGITLTNSYSQFKVSGLEIKNISGIAPGFLVAGCAGCGVGVLGLVGVTGAVTLLPLGGFLVQLTGIGLLIWIITSIGNPEVCSISES